MATGKTRPEDDLPGRDYGDENDARVPDGEDENRQDDSRGDFTEPKPISLV